MRAFLCFFSLFSFANFLFYLPSLTSFFIFTYVQICELHVCRYMDYKTTYVQLCGFTAQADGFAW